MSDYPLRHVSIRGPWRAAGWAGGVCRAPQLNGAGAKLRRIAGAKRDDADVLGADRVRKLIAEVCSG